MDHGVLSQFAATFAALALANVETRLSLDQQAVMQQQTHTSGLRAAFSRKKTPQHLYCYPTKMWLDVIVGQLKLCESRKDGLKLMNHFMDAHLLHCPLSRSQHKVSSESTKLQPTAKGIAVLEEWYYQRSYSEAKNMGEVRSILQSAFNTMELVKLERTPGTNRLYVSTGVIILLWHRMLGSSPQVYSGPEQLNTSEYNQRVKEDLSKRFNPLGMYPQSQTPTGLDPLMDCLASASRPQYNDDPPQAIEHPVRLHSLDFNEVPYFSRSLVHPNSTNLMHYFDNRGMRFFKNVRLERPARSRFASPEVYEAPCIVSGHAVWQWIMDCTTVTNSEEGLMLADMILNNGFLARVEEPVVDAWAAIGSGSGSGLGSKDHRLGPHCLYRFTPRGRRLLKWGPAALSDEAIDQVSLREDDAYSSFVSRVAAHAAPGANLADPVSVLQMVIGTTPQTPLPPYSEVPSPAQRKRRPPPLQLQPEQAPEPPFPGHAWRWEYAYDLKSVDAAFDGYVGLQLIMREPSLKLLFKEHLQQRHCRGTADFVDCAEHFLRLAEEWLACEGTQTHREVVQSELLRLARVVAQQYTNDGAPFELNVSAKLRKAWGAALGQSDIPAMVPIVSALRAECWWVLEGCAMDFKRDKELRQVPTFRKYVVAKTLRRPVRAGVAM